MGSGRKRRLLLLRIWEAMAGNISSCQSTISCRFLSCKPASLPPSPHLVGGSEAISDSEQQSGEEGELTSEHHWLDGLLQITILN